MECQRRQWILSWASTDNGSRLIENALYCPILHTRVAETKALGQLATPVKDRIWPVFVARPWPNAKHLDRTWDKLEEAFSKRPFALDLDRSFGGGATEAGTEFRRLLDPTGGYKAYYELLAQIPFAAPVLQPSADALTLQRQLERAGGLDRGVVVRARFSSSGNLPLIIETLKGLDIDAVFVVDAEWARDLLVREAWVEQSVRRIVSDLPQVEVAASGSSFPSSFVDVGRRKAFRVEERILHATVQRGINAARVVYSDWGSTRPPAPATPMTSKPRLDLSLVDQWISFRQEGAEQYRELANRMIEDPLWPQKTQTWGTYQYVITAENLPGAIKSPIAAAAARINLHLHRQATTGAPGAATDDIEPYED